MKRIFVSLVFLLFSVYVFGQYSNSNLIVSDKFEAFEDSIKSSESPFILPVFGNKVRAKGWDLPLPGGIMVNYNFMRQNINLTKLEVGVGDWGPVDITDLVEFEYIRVTTNALSFRPDVWVFPFMNVYGIYNQIWSRTNVKIIEPVDWPIPEVQADGWGAGFGTVLAAGVGKMWFSSSFSFTWTNTTATDEPVFAFNNGLRVGLQVYSRNRKHSGAIWIGANYLNYSGTNSGSYLINQIIPEEKPKLEELKGELEGMLEGLNDRYNDWCSQPGNGPKCTILDPVIQEIVNQIEDRLAGFEPPDVYIDYKFDKEPAQTWNMLVGTQYHYSKHWEFRVEVGFWNEKFTASANVNYRLGFWHRKN